MKKVWTRAIHIPYQCEDCGSDEPFDHPQSCNGIVYDPSYFNFQVPDEEILLMKQPAFVMKRNNLYWCRGQQWSPNIDEAITYFVIDNARKKGPPDGTIVPVVITSTIVEVKK